MTTRTTVTPAVELKQGSTFTATHLGKLSEIARYETTVPQFKRAIRGKVFLKGLLGLTGMEVSVTTLPAGAALKFLHRHRAHEELYLFTAGRGQMQVDGETFDVQEGSVVRIAPGGARTLRAAADEELRYLCIQAREGTMPDAEAADDGQPLTTPVVWP
jgi:mannose-6-phosphate isomerase-like protein (cupin superfamily)